MEWQSKVIAKLLKECSLETRLKVHLRCEDYDNWNNGEYTGKANEQAEEILEIVEKWLEDKAELRENKDENN